MKANRNASRVTCMMSVGVACLPFAYIGACFAVLALPGAVQIPPLPTNPASNIQVRYISINGEWNRYPDYHGLPEWVFGTHPQLRSVASSPKLLERLLSPEPGTFIRLATRIDHCSSQTRMTKAARPNK